MKKQNLNSDAKYVHFYPVTKKSLDASKKRSTNTNLNTKIQGYNSLDPQMTEANIDSLARHQ